MCRNECCRRKVTRDPRKAGCKCDQCPLNHRKPVWPKTNRNAKLVVLGESPGFNEELMGQPFVGKSGALLDAACDKLLIPKAQLHVTNAVLCRPTKTTTAAEWKQALACCRPRVRRELARVETRNILALGGRALQSVTEHGKIFHWFGSPLTGAKFAGDGRTKLKRKERPALSFARWQVLGSLHPAYCLREPQWTPVFQIHLDRAWDMANGRLSPWQWPEIITEPGPRMRAVLRDWIKRRTPLGSDVETSGLDPIRDSLLDVGLATNEVAISAPWYRLDQNDKDLILKTLRTCPQIGQHYSHDVTSFVNQTPLSINRLVYLYLRDTLAAASIVAPRLSHKLGVQMAIEFHAPSWKSEFKSVDDDAGTNRYVSADPTVRAEYNAKDCVSTWLLDERYTESEGRLDQTYNGRALMEEQMALYRIAVQMRVHGIAVDTKNLERHKRSLKIRRGKALGPLRRFVKRFGITDYKPTSTPQLRSIMEQLGVKPSAWSEKTGEPSWNAKALLSVATDGDNPDAARFASSLLRYRRFDKLLRTYVTGIETHEQAYVSQSSKSYSILTANAGWNPSGARTGRWASRDPNLMNIPKPKVVGGKVVAPGLRDLFCAFPELWLVAADYSQLESRILALVSGDENLSNWHNADIDVHTRLAAELFQKPESEVTPEERELAKRARYGIHYGGSAKTIWRALVVQFPTLALRDVKRLIDTFYKIHPGILAYQQDLLRRARLDGFVEAPISGRRFYFYGMVEPTKVFNLPIQMSAADIINPAMRRLWAILEALEFPLLQVHDDLTLQGPDPVRLATKMATEMARPVTVRNNTVVFPVDFKVAAPCADRKTGGNWGNAQKADTVEDVERIYDDWCKAA